jgi:hypothetical protein
VSLFEIILRAVSHCFNVRIRVLSTANPERFIDYNSPNNSSTVYLGFIDRSLHYVRLQPKSTGKKLHFKSMVTFIQLQKKMWLCYVVGCCHILFYKKKQLFLALPNFLTTPLKLEYYCFQI